MKTATISWIIIGIIILAALWFIYSTRPTLLSPTQHLASPTESQL